MHPEGISNMASWMDGAKPTRYTGIFRTSRGYRVRVRAMDPGTGTLKEVNREFAGVTLEGAVVRQAEMRELIRNGARGEKAPRPKYGDYATSLFERKVATKEL